MSAPVLGPSERAAWEAVKQWAASAFCLDSETPEDAARTVTATINALLAAEPEAETPSVAEFMTWKQVDAPAAPAPDAELDRLLEEYYQLGKKRGGQPVEVDFADQHEHDCQKADLYNAFAAHLATVQRREAAARGEVVGTATLHAGMGAPLVVRDLALVNWKQVITDGDTDVVLVRAAHPEG